MLRKRLALAAVLISIAIPCHAETIALQKSAAPVQHDYPAVSLDILGLELGASAQAATELLKKEFGSEPDVMETAIHLNYRSIPMQTEAYVGGLTINRQYDSAQAGHYDSMTVGLSPPTTDNVVVGIRRNVKYPDALSAPLVSDVLQQLEKKYGKPSSLVNGGHKLIVKWVFDGSRQVPCNRNNCWTAMADFDPGKINLYKGYVENDKALIMISADVALHRNDPSRVQALDMAIEDRATKLVSGHEALKQIETAGQAAYEKQAKPQNAPRL